MIRRISGIRVDNQSPAAMQSAPPVTTVIGAPMRDARVPAISVPSGITPVNDSV